MKRKPRRRTASRPISDTSSTRGSRATDVSQESTVDRGTYELDHDHYGESSTSVVPEPAPMPWRASPLKDSPENVNMDNVDVRWLDTLYREGFEAVLGSWMGRYSCPFLYAT